ncbi:MAG: hypothetical protein K2N34_12425 [Lachnospiraceae bacterium]|nr:hypothetical protein [Lachnospiraceae bacterium]
MATYGQLLIGAGGGVIDHHKQSARQDGATLVIGLGGTGASAVMKLKKEVYRQLKPDNEEAAVPKYEAIHYLIVDSDDSGIQAQNGGLSDIDRHTEFFSIANTAIKATFAAEKVLASRSELYWLDYKNISIADASKGAGGIRQVGRFLLVDRAAALYAKIKSEMQSALMAAGKGSLNIHICAGISGGTGSGTFLDICYLVRKALVEIGKSESSVCGYFFMPDVNLSVPEIIANPLISEYIKVNGYAALQELDYCMNFSRNKDSFKMNYGFTRVDSAIQPVDLCYLVSTTDSSGNILKNGYSYAMGVVADHIISFLAKVELPPGADSANNEGLTLEGHISNLNTIKAGIKLQHGAGIDYNILGAAIAEMPLSEIATYLGAKMFERFSDIYDRVPTEQARNEFLMNHQLQYEALRSELTKGCIPEVNFPDRYDIKMYKTGGGEVPFGQYAEENFLSKNSGKMQENFKAMLKELGEYKISQDGTSLISRTYKGLCDDYVTKFEFGPFYAKRILYGNNNKNIIDAVDGYINENKNNLESEMRQEQIRKDELTKAETDLRGANFLNERKFLKLYMDRLNSWYVHLYRVELYQKMGYLLEEYRRMLSQLDSNFFDVLTVVLDTLRQTFAQNARVLSEGINDGYTYTWKILSVKDIKDSLDKDVENLNLNNTLHDLMDVMFSDCTKWITQDQNEIARVISNFVLNHFRTATQKTMTDYLKIKFHVDNSGALEANIENEIIQNKLWDRSIPLFWQNPMYHMPVGEQNTLTVPYDSDEIKNAADHFGVRQRITVRRSNIIDKLSVMRFYSGLPMYAYQGIMELRNTYEADKKAGRHLYERGEVNWNELLPSPVPESFEIDLPIERIKKRNNALTEEFKKAEMLGIVSKDSNGHWNIQTTEDFDIEQFLKEETGGKQLSELDAAAIDNVIGKLKEAQKHLLEQNPSLERIECQNSIAGSEDQVMLDFYLMSPVLNQKLHDELVKRSSIQDTIRELEEQRERTAIAGREKTDFLNAIFTGVLSYGKKIMFEYDNFGIPVCLELQNNTMTYGQSGAYQAYLTYQGLSNDIKERIRIQTRARLDEEDSVQIREAVDSLKEKMPQRVIGYLGCYAGDIKQAEIEQFYQEFMQAFQNFRVLNDYL